MLTGDGRADGGGGGGDKHVADSTETLSGEGAKEGQRAER